MKLNQQVISLCILMSFFFFGSNLLFAQGAVPTYSFKLLTDAKTSAAIYNSDSVMVRTLWSGVDYKAGNYQIKWDGTNDIGDTMPKQNYTVKVLSNNVKYEWEGTVGNSSDSMTGATKYHSFDIIHCMAISGNTAFCGAGYNEGNTSEFKFALSTPQQKTLILPISHSTDQSSFYNATDGVNIYWAGFDPFSYNAAKNFVFATKISSDEETIFSAGIPLKMTYGRNYLSVINFIDDAAAIITGMAVQKARNFLFVSHKGLNRIDVIDKTSGAMVQQIATFTAPSGLSVDMNDNLWVIYAANKVEKFSVNASGLLTPLNISLTGLLSPLSIAVSPDNSVLLVADGGTSQQLKAYSNTTGNQVWVYGSANGYVSDPTVNNNKFYFSDNTNDVRIPFICYQPDGSFWVSDPGNYRVQHFSATKNFINSIMYFPHNYSVSADHNNPKRIFCEYLEFNIDYTKPLAPNNGSWSLVKNWRATITPPFYRSFMSGIFRSVTTLSNGRTYALLDNKNTNKASVVELPSTGSLRFTGIEFAAYSTQQIYEDGSIRGVSGNNVGGNLTWKKQLLVGFDVSNNPIWGQEVALASTNATTDMDPILGGTHMQPAEITSSGIIVSFSGNAPPYGSKEYHLGGIKLGDNKWLWKTAMTTHKDYQGVFPATGYFDIGNGSQYSGNIAMAMERSIFWGFNGEGWKGSQTNKFNHVYDNGLFVGQFGTTGAEVGGSEAPAKMAGNSFSPVVVKVDSTYYLYHNDESYHGGVHRWKISGIKSIQQQSISIPSTFVRTSELANVPGIDLMKGLPYDTILQTNTSGWTRIPATETSNTWSAKTNVKTYSDSSSPDLQIKYSNIEGPYQINRDLGSNINLSEWTLSGEVSYEENMPNTNISMHLDVLDDQSKPLVRFYNTINFGSSNTVSVFANNTLIGAGDNVKMNPLTQSFQPVKICMSKGSIAVSYANFAPVTIGSFDAAGKLGNPKTMRLYFDYVNGGNAYTKIIDLNKMRFLPTVYSVLPVTLTSINAVKKNEGVQVEWNTEKETSINKYEIEKSIDGSNFYLAGIVVAKNNEAEKNNYFWYDSKPNDGINYYRIKTIEFSGEVKYSKIVNVTFHDATSGFEVYPNPITSDQCMVYFKNISKGNYTIKLYSLDGHNIFNKMICHPGGSYRQPLLQEAHLPAGTYSLKIAGNDIFFNTQLIKLSAGK